MSLKVNLTRYFRMFLRQCTLVWPSALLCAWAPFSPPPPPPPPPPPLVSDGEGSDTPEVAPPAYPPHLSTIQTMICFSFSSGYSILFLSFSKKNMIRQFICFFSDSQRKCHNKRDHLIKCKKFKKTRQFGILTYQMYNDNLFQFFIWSWYFIFVFLKNIMIMQFLRFFSESQGKCSKFLKMCINSWSRLMKGSEAIKS